MHIENSEKFNISELIIIASAASIITPDDEIKCNTVQSEHFMHPLILLILTSLRVKLKVYPLS